MGKRVFCCLGEYSVRRMTSVITVSPIRRGAIASGGGNKTTKKQTCRRQEDAAAAAVRCEDDTTFTAHVMC